MTRQYPTKTQGLTRLPLFWANRFAPGLGGESGEGRPGVAWERMPPVSLRPDKEVGWHLNVTMHSFTEGDADAEQFGSYS
jgi:hypothetical protein